MLKSIIMLNPKLLTYKYHQYFSLIAVMDLQI